MNQLQEKANRLRSALPTDRSGTPPEMKGKLLGTLSHKEGRIRIVWDTYEGHSFLTIRLWTIDEAGQLWPSKTGFAVKVREIPILADAIGQAVDLAMSAIPASSMADSSQPRSPGGFTEGNAPF